MLFGDSFIDLTKSVYVHGDRFFAGGRRYGGLFRVVCCSFFRFGEFILFNFFNGNVNLLIFSWIMIFVMIVLEM